MKKINRKINQVVESSVSGVTFKVTNDEIELCIISFSDKENFGSAKKIIVNKLDIPEEIKVLLDSFVDKQIDNNVAIDDSISINQKQPKKSTSRKKKG